MKDDASERTLAMADEPSQSCDHDQKDCMYGAADKASAALNDAMQKFEGPGKGSLPKSMKRG